MKTKELMKWMMACALVVFTLASCSDDDDDNVPVPDAVTRAFTDKYAGVGRVDWDREKGGYLVAEFWKDGKEHEAWFDNNGEWFMTEIDHGRDLTSLPQAVRAGYEATAYAQTGWSVDDIDEIQRPAYETFYIIEVEKRGQPDYDLYFDTNGTLFRELQGEGGGNHGDFVDNRTPAEIQSFIESNYPGHAVQLDSDGHRHDAQHPGRHTSGGGSPPSRQAHR